MLEYKRKLVHVLSGVIVAFFVLHFPKYLSILSVSLIILFLSSLSLLSVQDKTREIANIILPHFDRKCDTDAFPCRGAFKFFIGILIPLVFFEAKIAAGGILILAVGDGLAGLFGHYAGVHKLYKEKSVEGSLAFFAASFFCLLLFLEGTIAPQWILAACIILTFWEVITPIDDNLSIPFLASLFLFLAQSF